MHVFVRVGTLTCLKHVLKRFQTNPRNSINISKNMDICATFGAQFKPRPHDGFAQHAWNQYMQEWECCLNLVLWLFIYFSLPMGGHDGCNCPVCTRIRGVQFIPHGPITGGPAVEPRHRIFPWECGVLGDLWGTIFKNPFDVNPDGRNAFCLCPIVSQPYSATNGIQLIVQPKICAFSCDIHIRCFFCMFFIAIPT